MKQEHKKVPYFTAGQVLSSATLNAFFGYNDEQMRITRNSLLGYGIVEGLNYEYDGKTFKLEPGYGFNAEGNLICVEKEIVYTAAELNEDKKSYTLRLSEKLDTTVDIPNNIDKYLVCVEWVSTSTIQSNCSQISCDYKTINKSVGVEIHLIPQNPNNIFKAFNILEPRKEHVKLGHLRDCSAMPNTHLMRAKVSPLFHENREKVNQGLLAVCKILNPEFKSNSKKIYPQNCWVRFMPLCANLTSRLMAVYSLHNNAWHKTMLDVPQYYLQHLEDMAMAINDTLRYYNDMICMYPQLPTNAKTIKEQTIVLGYGNMQNNNSNCERQNYWPNQSAEVYHAVLRLQNLIMRVITLSEKFKGEHEIDCDLKLSWYNPNVEWALRPIPYYYKHDDELTKYWGAPDLSPIRHTVDYKNAPAEGEVDDPYGKLFLQGHLGKNTDEVRNAIRLYSEKHQLDINTEIVEMEKRTLADKRKFRNDVGANMIELYEKYITKVHAITSPKKGHVDTDIKNKQNSNSLYLAFRGHIKEFVEAGQKHIILPIEQVVEARKNIENVEIEDFVNLLKFQMKEEYKEDDRTYGHRYARAFDSFKLYLKKSYNERYKFSKMVQGYPEHSTIVIFSYKNKVVFDVCL